MSPPSKRGAAGVEYPTLNTYLLPGLSRDMLLGGPQLSSKAQLAFLSGAGGCGWHHTASPPCAVSPERIIKDPGPNPAQISCWGPVCCWVKLCPAAQHGDPHSAPGGVTKLVSRAGSFLHSLLFSLSLCPPLVMTSSNTFWDQSHTMGPPQQVRAVPAPWGLGDSCPPSPRGRSLFKCPCVTVLLSPFCQGHRASRPQAAAPLETGSSPTSSCVLSSSSRGR